MNVCRLCDSEIKSDAFENIFNENLDPPIWKIVADLSNLTILESDPYTKLVCFSCFDQLQRFHIFRKIILYTNWKMRRNSDNSNNNKSDDADIEQVPANVDNNSNDCGHSVIEQEKIEIEGHLSRIEHHVDQNDDNFNNTGSKNATINENNVAVNGNGIQNNNGLDRKVGQSLEGVNADFNDHQRSGSPIDIDSDDYILFVEEETRGAGQHSSQIDDFNKSIIDQNDETNINEDTTDASTVCNENHSDSCDDNQTNCIESKINRNQQCTKSSTSSKVQRGKIRKNQKHQCDVCNKTFSLKSSLKNHLRLHASKKWYHCTICGSKFSYKNGFEKHIKTNNVAKQCKFCGETFSTGCAYRKHRDEHLRCDDSMLKANIYKWHQCKICSKRFLFHMQLVRHLRTHTGEKPFKCGICDRAFSEKSNMIRHLAIVHQQQYKSTVCKERKPSVDSTVHSECYECCICKRTFSHETALQTHMSVHTREEPVKCNSNDGTSTRSVHPTDHSSVHTGEQSNHCEMPATRLSERYSFRSHLKVDYGEEEF